jgi:hypothetical protein
MHNPYLHRTEFLGHMLQFWSFAPGGFSVLDPDFQSREVAEVISRWPTAGVEYRTRRHSHLTTTQYLNILPWSLNMIS